VLWRIRSARRRSAACLALPRTLLQLCKAPLAVIGPRDGASRLLLAS
jgi:hypothetical protein